MAPKLAHKRDRADVLASFLAANFPPSSLARVVDVAGGRGDVSAALLRRGLAKTATVVEPVARRDRPGKTQHDGSEKNNEAETAGDDDDGDDGED